MINVWTKGTQYSHRPIGRSDDMDSADRSLFKLAQVYYSGGSRAKEHRDKFSGHRDNFSGHRDKFSGQSGQI